MVLLSITDKEVLLMSLRGATCCALLLLCLAVFVGCDICCLCCAPAKEGEEEEKEDAEGGAEGVKSSVLLLDNVPT